jgi:hypothetical protein
MILTNLAYGKEEGSDTSYDQQMFAIQRIFVQFGIPIYFYMSGVSATYFKFDMEFPLKVFVISKTRKLLLPLAWGIFFMLMPAYYMS